MAEIMEQLFLKMALWYVIIGQLLVLVNCIRIHFDIIVDVIFIE